MESIINVNDMLKNVKMKIRVKGVKKLTFRLRVATVLIRLACRIAGIGIEVEPLKIENV